MFHGMLCAALAALSFSASGAAPKPMLAVMPFQARSLDSESVDGLTTALSAEILVTGNARVMERSQMTAILSEQGFEQSGACDGSECAVSVGKLLAVDQIVLANLSRIGDLFSLNVRRVDVATGEVRRTVLLNGPARMESVLTNLIPRAARGLFDSSSTSSSVAVPRQGDASRPRSVDRTAPAPAAPSVPPSAPAAEHESWWYFGPMVGKTLGIPAKDAGKVLKDSGMPITSKKTKLPCAVGIVVGNENDVLGVDLGIWTDAAYMGFDISFQFLQFGSDSRRGLHVGLGLGAEMYAQLSQDVYADTYEPYSYGFFATTPLRATYGLSFMTVDLSYVPLWFGYDESDVMSKDGTKVYSQYGTKSGWAFTPTSGLLRFALRF
jgi:hypothetical protein